MASIAKRPDGKYRARYVGPDGRQHAKHFARRVDADRWLSQQVVKVADGTWIDPQQSRRTVRQYAERWLELQVHHRPSTASATKARMAQITEAFGDRTLVSIQRSDVQAWVSQLATRYAPSTVEATYRLFAQVMLSAVEDRMLSASPCRRIRLPERDSSKVRVPTADELAAVVAAAPAHARALIVATAGSGMRLGEVTGLTVDRVDFLRRAITVDRQLVTPSAGQPRFGPPKTKASVRTIPVPALVTDAIGEHLAMFPSPELVFRNTAGRPWRRNAFGEEWRRWTRHAGVSFDFHELRHLYASALIEEGQSVKVIQERLGHSSAVTTLDTYGHLMPNDEDRTRDAIGRMLAVVTGR